MINEQTTICRLLELDSAARATRSTLQRPQPTAGDRMVAHCQLSPRPIRWRCSMMEETSACTTPWLEGVSTDRGGWFLHENDAFFRPRSTSKSRSYARTRASRSRVGAECTPLPAPMWGRGEEVPGREFVIYHSAYDSDHTEGPYNPNPDPLGGERTACGRSSARTTEEQDVYAEMARPGQSDPRSKWHSTTSQGPQIHGRRQLCVGLRCVCSARSDQIEARRRSGSRRFRTCTGTRVHRHDRRRSSAHRAKLYRVDPNVCRYEVSRSSLAARKTLLDERWGGRRHAINRPAIRTRRQFMDLWREKIAKGELG